jgi:hypothetical protein
MKNKESDNSEDLMEFGTSTLDLMTNKFSILIKTFL